MPDTQSNQSASPLTSSVVLILEGLGAHYLQCYGNSSLATDSFNQLAAEGGLADFIFAESTDVADVYRSWWTGLHPLQPTSPAPNLPQQLESANVQSILLTDSEAVAELAEAANFGQVISLSPWESQVAAESLSETYFAVRVAEILELAAELPQPFVLWVHLRGFQQVWDAPYEMREAFADDEDPDPPDFVLPPQLELAGSQGSNHQGWDERLGFQQAYFAQLTVLDECLGVLVEELAEANCNLALSAPGGYPLAEHDWVGSAPLPLAEQTHVPLLWRTAAASSLSENSGHRDAELGPSSKLYDLVVDWHINDPTEKTEHVRPPYVLSESPTSAALRTPHWTLIVIAETELEDEQVQLFVRPDDRYEVNNVAMLCPDVVEHLREFLVQLQSELAAGLPNGWPPLPAELHTTEHE